MPPAKTKLRNCQDVKGQHKNKRQIENAGADQIGEASINSLEQKWLAKWQQHVKSLSKIQQLH